jgi:hypothetical protein
MVIRDVLEHDKELTNPVYFAVPLHIVIKFLKTLPTDFVKGMFLSHLLSSLFPTAYHLL